jgi:AcrR family transcriptional regulator
MAAAEARRTMPDPGPHHDAGDMRASILSAARRCFTRWGVQRTKMGDIARELGIARPNLYRFYDSKQSLVLAVMLEEHRALNEERRRTIEFHGPVAGVIVQAVLVGWRRAVTNEQMRVLNVPENFALASVLRAVPEMIDVRKDYWFAVFDYGRARGEIRADLDNEDLMFWLTAVQATFLEDAATFPDEDAVEDTVVRFVLPALLESSARGTA